MLSTEKRDPLLQSISSKQSEKHTSESSEFSQNSITRYIETRLKNQHAISRREIQQMNQRVKNELMRNRKTYDKLIMMNPYFSMKLYSPQNVFNSQQYNQTSINLMLKQLDLLLEDGHLLEKQIKKTQLRKMQSEYMNNYQIDNSKSHYAYIRKIWLGSNESDAKNPLERIEQLNKKVVLVKNNVYSVTDVQKKSYERTRSNDDYASVVNKINEVVQQTKEYTLLKQKYQDLKMSYEDLQQKYSLLAQNLQQIEIEKNEAIRKLKQQNDQCKRLLKQSKEKQLIVQIRQAQLLLKIKQLENIIRQKKNDKTEPLPNISSLNSDLSKTKLIINMDNIKFRKMSAQQITIASNQKQRNNDSEAVTPNNNQEKEVNQNNQPSVSRFSPEKQKCQNYNQMNERSFYLADQKSHDARKGRFARMRSPGGGKLMKIRGNEEILSPKVRESEAEILISSEK